MMPHQYPRSGGVSPVPSPLRSTYLTQSESNGLWHPVVRRSIQFACLVVSAAVWLLLTGVVLSIFQ